MDFERWLSGVGRAGRPDTPSAGGPVTPSGWGIAGMGRRPARRRAAVLVLAAGVSSVSGPPGCGWGAERSPDVILVVLDTVRAASTSLCGYERPTTPVLERLGREGWSVSCAAVSPGTWTVPSHASLFTGLEVTAFRGGAVEPTRDATLAGKLAARGYATVVVSANLVLKKPEWLTAGFERRRIARDYDELAGDALADAVRAEIAAVAADRPLFLMVNIADAHAPYPEIPEGVGWVPAQRAVQHRMWSTDPNTPFRRYVTGAMEPSEADRYRARLRNGYDYGIFEADRSLGRVLSVLEDGGRLANARIVVTSDHGEFVGEHGQIGHGDTLYEPGVRVPYLARDTGNGAGIALPDPMSARAAFTFLLGEPPDAQGPPSSVVTRQPSDRPGYDGVAVWGAAGRKLLWRDGTFERYDLTADPTESAPVSMDASDELTKTLGALVDQHRAALNAKVAPDQETVELLRAAGYVE